ncbi:MAG: hypothetical protein MMC33_002510 [Icmadophila ericetorum]|nr:hypothetical protein [Icmadophila ericetorum]
MSSQSPPSEATKFNIPLLTSYYTQGPITSSSVSPQLELRAQIISAWNIAPGSQVLEIGCGQGDATIVLAEAVGEEGHVDGIDPGSPDYGSPVTLGQSQARLKESPLGSQITFINKDPEDYLSTSTKHYDYIIFFNSLWYFSTPSKIRSLLTQIISTKRIRTLCVAEYALQASNLNAVPHLLAALAQSALNSRSAEQTNICTAVSPAWIKATMSNMGNLSIKQEATIHPASSLAEGRWEVQAVLAPDFLKRVKEVANGDEELEVALSGTRDAVVGSLEAVGAGVRGVETMSVWWGVWELQN